MALEDYVTFPKDKFNNTIHVDDFIKWEEDEGGQIISLTYFGNRFWTAVCVDNQGKEFETDNLENGFVSKMPEAVKHMSDVYGLTPSEILDIYRAVRAEM